MSTTGKAESVTLEQALRQAVDHHQAGRLHEAEQLYRAILQALPNQPDANHNLGVLAGQVGQHAAGLPYLKTALEVNPAQGQYALSYAEALLATGQAGEAQSIIHAAMQRGFNTPAAQALLHKTGIAVKTEAPTFDEINQLVALFNTGRHAELESRACGLAERCPQSGFAWKALGASLQAQGKDALPALHKAAALLPDDAEAHNNLGDALRCIEQPADAMACCKRALEINPGFAEAHCNLGLALQDLGRLDEALVSYARALEINPGLAKAHNNLGNALRDLGRLDDAVASYTQALKINPDYVKALSNLLFIHNHLDNQPDARLLARRFDELVTRQARPYTNWRNVPDPARGLRIGMVSGDLRNHPVGYFLESLLAALANDASRRLEFIAYPCGVGADALTERIKRCCHGWHPAAGISDEHLAQAIRDDGIDILIDLSGHTANNRLPLFAWKPAPVQVSWLGYFATTGMTAMDYLIADPWTLPESEEAYFTEKIRRLPETRLCFTPPDVAVSVSPLPALTNGYVTFGCFNNLAKINDDVVALWARVLQATPGSRLFLKTKQLGEATMRQ
ncbi:MAG: tetratricopeptide repeat protein, partial [Sulfuricellaceae bacterium]